MTVELLLFVLLLLFVGVLAVVYLRHTAFPSPMQDLSGGVLEHWDVDVSSGGSVFEIIQHHSMKDGVDVVVAYQCGPRLRGTNIYFKAGRQLETRWYWKDKNDQREKKSESA